MSGTSILGAVIGTYALVMGAIALLVECAKAKRKHRRPRRLPIAAGVAGMVLGTAILVLVVSIAGGGGP
ncbi:hypothetical protein [uncultured Amnibacterium sp.]|uniref:hypothetical protein n=1 Tax=uncultured Amnibacterium sp. TaxID=1631851 RepID=UPI0035CA96A6